MIQHQETVKHVGDALSITTLAGALVGYLPAIAALMTIIWTGIRILETSTVREWRNKRKQK